MSDAPEVDIPVQPPMAPLARRIDPTGVPHLDELLGGGIPRGSLALVVGPPGSGKTTLAAQMAVASAQAGHKALILTAFSEPVTKLITHLRTMTFFDENLLADRLQVLSLTQFLPQGLDATGDEIRALVRRSRYQIIVLDGFRGVHGAREDEQAARRFLYTMGASLGLLDATTIITSEAEPRDAALYPEATTADILLGMHYRLSGLRENRSMEVIKVRGLAKMPGLHALDLSADGVTIYPRLEARMAPMARAHAARDADVEAAAVQDTLPQRRLGFGLPELDALLGGGLTSETTTMLLGSPGAGKTLLALHWLLAGAADGDGAVFLGFRESQSQILYAAQAFGLQAPLRAALGPGGRIAFMRQAPVELDPDALAQLLLDAIERVNARRLVIDSIGEFERAVAEGSGMQRIPGFFAALIESLRACQVTTLALREGASLVAPGQSIPADTLSALADNVLLLQHIAHQGRLHRVVSVPKMRLSAHDLQLREFTISAPEGIRVLHPFESEEGVLPSLTELGESYNRGQSGDLARSGIDEGVR